MSNVNKILYNVKFSKESNDMSAPPEEIDSHVSMAYRNESVYFFGETGHDPVPFTDVYLSDIWNNSKFAAQNGTDVRRVKDMIYDWGIRAGLTVDFPSLELVIPKDARNITSVNVSINEYLSGKPCSIEYEFVKSTEQTNIMLSMLVNTNGYINIHIVSDNDTDVIGFKSDALLDILSNSFRLLKTNKISRTVMKSEIRHIINSNDVCGKVLFV